MANNLSKDFFEHIFLKYYFSMNSKSVSVMAGPPSLYCNQNKSGKRFYIQTIGFMTSIARVFIISAPFVSQYTNIDSSHWLRKRRPLDHR